MERSKSKSLRSQSKRRVEVADLEASADSSQIVEIKSLIERINRKVADKAKAIMDINMEGINSKDLRGNRNERDL